MPDARILFEDDDFLAFNKNPGELVQGDRRGDPSLIDLLAESVRADWLAPVHRLDRPASGLVLFAKTRRFFTAMTELFRRREVEKTYWAVTEKAPARASGVLRHVLRADHRRNLVSAREGTAANAILSYQAIGSSDRYFFLIVRPVTGRQHQIRSQLARAGCPVKGDVKYGARRGRPDRSIMLHARRLVFSHPFNHRLVRLTAPAPPGLLWELFAAAAAGADDAGP